MALFAKQSVLLVIFVVQVSGSLLFVMLFICMQLSGNRVIFSNII